MGMRWSGGSVVSRRLRDKRLGRVLELMFGVLTGGLKIAEDEGREIEEESVKTTVTLVVVQGFDVGGR